MLTQRFSNSAEYTLDPDSATFEDLIHLLTQTGHVLVHTATYEEDGTYIIASPSLQDHPQVVKRILSESFHVNGVAGASMDENSSSSRDEFIGDESQYLLVLHPEQAFFWNGLVILDDLSERPVNLEPKEGNIRIIADGPVHRLNYAKQCFMAMMEGLDLKCAVQQQAHIPKLQKELRKIERAIVRLTESIVDSVHHVRNSMQINATKECQELMENWFWFAQEHGTHAQKYMEHQHLVRFNRMLVQLAISWVTFICDDCDPNDRRTFKWAVNALEYTYQRTKRTLLLLPDNQFSSLQFKVSSVITLLMGHFDILGARTSLEAQKEKEQEIARLKAQAANALLEAVEEDEPVCDPLFSFIDPDMQKFWQRVIRECSALDSQRIEMEPDYQGRVLDNDKFEDRSLLVLASYRSNIAMRWQQGKFVGAGAFGSVYQAINLDSGSVMAVKEIKITELTGLPNLYEQIKDELAVMELLQHPNIVDYYGIEVHRDKVYIFEEYCQGGSLAALLEHGRIEDEGIMQLYTLQMLEGISYLHSQNIAHRDVKPGSKSFLSNVIRAPC